MRVEEQVLRQIAEAAFPTLGWSVKPVVGLFCLRSSVGTWMFSGGEVVSWMSVRGCLPSQVNVVAVFKVGKRKGRYGSWVVVFAGCERAGRVRLVW